MVSSMIFLAIWFTLGFIVWLTYIVYEIFGKNGDYCPLSMPILVVMMPILVLIWPITLLCLLEEMGIR